MRVRVKMSSYQTSGASLYMLNFFAARLLSHEKTCMFLKRGTQAIKGFSAKLTVPRPEKLCAWLKLTSLTLTPVSLDNLASHDGLWMICVAFMRDSVTTVIFFTMMSMINAAGHKDHVSVTLWLATVVEST